MSKTLSSCAFALLACVATEVYPQDTVSYAVMTPIGQPPRAVRVAPTLAVAARERIDLAAVPPDKRRAVVMATLDLVRTYAQKHGLQVVGPPIVVNHVISDASWEFAMMMPITSPRVTPKPEPGVQITEAPSGLALAMDHHGPIEALFDSYKRVAERAVVARLGPLTWEQYITDPSTTPASDQRIRVFRAVAGR